MKRWLPVLAFGLLAVLVRDAVAEPAGVIGDLAMRAGPGPGYSVILTIVRGSTVDTRRCRGMWCEVRVAGRRGFVSVRRLDFAAYAPPLRKHERDRERQAAGLKYTVPERTSTVSRGARELAPHRNAAPRQPEIKKIPAAEMPRGPLPPPPVVDPPQTVPSVAPRQTPSVPSQAPDKPQFKPPEGVPEISL